MWLVWGSWGMEAHARWFLSPFSGVNRHLDLFPQELDCKQTRRCKMYLTSKGLGIARPPVVGGEEHDCF